MTVTEQSSRKVIVGAGWTNPLTHAYVIESASWVHVFADAVELMQGVDYTVTNVLNPAGYAVTVTNPGSWAPTSWVLDARPPIDQQKDLTVGGTFGAKFEDGLDKETRRMQRVYDLARRGLKTSAMTPVGDNPYTIPAPVAGMVWGWNAAGTDIENKPGLSSADVAAFNAYVAAAQAAATASNGYAVASQASAVNSANSATAANASAVAAAATLAAAGLPTPVASTMLVRNSGNTAYDPKSYVDVRGLLSVPVAVATRTALKALDTTKDTTAYLKEFPREGIFDWFAGNYSANIAADTQEGIFIKANAIASNVGAWVRRYDGVAMARFFGAVGDGTTDDAAATNVGLIVAGALMLENRVYAVGSTINIQTDGQMLFGPQGRPGGVFNTGSTAGAALKWIGALSGTAVRLGSTTAGVDMHGGGLSNVQIDGNALALYCLEVKTVDNAVVEKVKLHNPRDNASAACLHLTSNANAFSTVNCIHNCTFRDIAIATSPSGFGLYNRSLGTSGGQNTTNCVFDNIHVTHTNNTAFQLSAVDTSVFTRCATSRLATGTGSALYLDGNAVSSKIVMGCLFNLFHPYVASGTPLIYADGQYSRQNKMILTGVDTFALPQLINGAELFFEYTGSGYTGVLATEAPYSRVAPLQIANYAVTDAKTLDWYEENTFVPVVSFGGASVGITYSTQLGEYTRIGDTVSFSLDITLTSKGSSTGNISIAGLPYAKKAGISAGLNVFAQNVTSGVGDTALSAMLPATTTAVDVRKIVTGTNTTLTNADITNTTILRISGSYKV